MDLNRLRRRAKHRRIEAEYAEKRRHCFLQHDMVIANDSGANVRADINNAYGAVATNHSGTSAPSTTYALMWWFDTTNNLIKRRNAANSAWLTVGSLDESFVIARSSNTILAGADRGKTFICTSTYTQTITAAATLGEGWSCLLRNNGVGVITVDPNSSETIDGVSTLSLLPGQSCVLVCDGSSFYTIGYQEGQEFPFIHLRDEKTSGTAGGSFTTGAWRTRVLNTEVLDTGGHCALSSNQFTLDAGTYDIKATAPGYDCDHHQLRLRNITDGATTLVGPGSYSAAISNVQTTAQLVGRFTIAGTKTFELQHQCDASSATFGFGTAAGFGETEIYAELTLTKIG